MMNSKFNLFTISSLMVWIILLVMLPLCFYTVLYFKTTLLEWTLMSIYSTPITFSIIVDPIGIMFSCAVLFISANVLSFSTIYMSEDKFKSRFTFLVLLFILSMNLLIFLPHFMILLLGWDGLGLVSFILVIYYQNPKSLAAGMITALTNRIGDVMLLLSIAWTLNQGHWLIINMWDSPMSIMQVFCITVAAMTKSAQMPFSSWLPAAMAAPTPVSALVHSSTLVTAGVFLLIRFYPFLHSISYFNTMLLLTSVSTMLMAGISATTECDMKKIIALSTLSQLGMMMTSIALDMPHLAFFHMLTHALFKALLFVCAGSFINSHMHSQDLRWMGNLSIQMPVASSCITLANLALCGFPFMAGFYSKDLIIESAMNMPNNLFMVSLSLVSIGLTSFYSIRFSVVTMWSSQLSSSFIHINEYMNIIKPMLFLSSVSIIMGSTMSWISPMSQSLFILPFHMKILPLALVMLGILLAWYMSTYTSMTSSSFMLIPLSHFGSCMMWYLVPLSSQFMMKFPFYTAHNYMKSMDQGWLELMSSNGIHSLIINSSNKIKSMTPSSPPSYNITASSLIMLALSFTIISNL